MSFEAPALLATLLLVPLAAAGYWLLQRRPPKYAVRYTNLAVLAGVAGSRRAWRRHAPAALLLAAFASLCVAFARPTMTVKALPVSPAALTYRCGEVLAASLGIWTQAHLIPCSRSVSHACRCRTFDG